MAQTEAKTVGDIVLDEQPMEYCRLKTTVTVPASTSYVAGQVLEADGAGEGDYKALATDGNAAAILLYPITNSAESEAAVTAVVIFQGPCIINEDELTGPSTLATATAALEALGIECREELG